MLSLGEIHERMGKLREWSLEGNAITRVFTFSKFTDGIEFVNSVARLAETHKHHPDIVITYTDVKVTLTTHDAGGLSEKDFILAEAIDTLPM